MKELCTLSIDADFSEAIVKRRLGFSAGPVVIAGRYELVRRIGRGGHGTVYEASERGLERRVAVKVLPLGDPDEAEREGQALAQLHHPNVVAIHSHGRGSDYRYFVLQLLEGPTLREWCSGKSPADIVTKYVEAGRGLEAAHHAGLVHRDFKPSNVRIGSSGEAVVVDFGLARHLRSLDEDSGEQRRVVGTIPYVAPERLLGQLGDERSDQWSFCVALWEALAGVNPFGACTEETSASERYKSIQSGPQGGEKIPKRVRRALGRGLSILPHDRFRSVDELIAEISERPKKRSRWADAVVGTLIALIVSVLVLRIFPMPQRSEGFIGDHFAPTLAESEAVAGDPAKALRILESAQRRGAEGDDARRLAEASRSTARAFESRGLQEDAWYAWTIAVVFAKSSGDESLVRETHIGVSKYLAKPPQRGNK